MRGGVAPLSWDTTLSASDPEADGLYEVTATFSRAPFGGQAVTYKFKVDRAADPRGGWEDGRNRQLFLRERAQAVTRPFNSAPDPVVTSLVFAISVVVAGSLFNASSSFAVLTTGAEVVATSVLWGRLILRTGAAAA